MKIDNNIYKIIDGHQDIAFNAIHVTGKDFLVANSINESHLLPPPQLNQSDYQRLSNSGVKIVFGVCFPYKIEGKDIFANFDSAKEEMLKQLNFYNDLEKRSDEKVKIIKSKNDLDFVLNSDGVLGLVLLVEDAIGVGIDLNNLIEFYDMGLRMVGMVWNRDNQFGGGTDTDRGLTSDGEKLLNKMEELGMILDTAHMNVNLFNDSLKVFKGKVMNSHTCTTIYNPHRRNLNNLQMKMISDRGGVLGIAFVPEFLNTEEKEATIDDVVKHIKHAVDVCGIDSVAFGSDFDGMSWPKYVPDLSSTSEYHNLIKKLEEIYSKEDVEKIIYLNWKNFLESSIL